MNVQSPATAEPLRFPLEHFRDNAYLTHTLHPYPAKFVPQIPARTIRDFSKPGDVVLDPFVGSGTTLVEARLAGRSAIGLDTNPLACLISRSKSTILDDTQLATCVHVANLAARRCSGQRDLDASLSGATAPIHPPPNHPGLSRWFSPAAVRELSIILTAIDECDDEIVRDLLKVALSSIIVGVSYQESDTRYAAVPKLIAPGETGRRFAARVHTAASCHREFAIAAMPGFVEVLHQDSCGRLPLRDESIGHIVTSPPYPNSYDYYLYHKWRMIWLGLDYKAAQGAEIGSRNKHNDLGLGIEAYLSKMRIAIEEWARVLRPGGVACIVVGDAIIRGQQFDLGDAFMELELESGFRRIHHQTYPLRKYTRTFPRGTKSGQKQGHIILTRK